MSPDCLIVGAGPTGLTLALELRRFGLPVRLIDKSDHPAQWSQALVLQARTLEQFDRYGVAGRFVAKGRAIRRARFWSDGDLIASLTFGRIPSRFPYVLFLPQSETEALLTRHLQSLGVEIERGTELTGFKDEPGSGVIAGFRKADGSVSQAQFRWLVGCDGAHSAVRNGLGVSFEGDSLGLRFSLGDLRLTGDDLPTDELTVHLHRGGDVLFLAKLKDDVYRAIVALHEQQGENGHRNPELPDFNSAFVRYGLKIHAESAEWLAPFYVSQRKAGSYRKGNVFLAGDASHIHSPVGGQGMNTGIQDAANLAWKLAAVADGAPEQLLDSYNEERGKVGDALLRGTSMGLRAATVVSPLLETIRDFVLKRAVRLEVVQKAIAAVVSETAIEYRDSSIVRDEADSGRLKAGDRLPDADCKDPPRTLLGHLRDARHLLVAVNVPAEEIPRSLRRTTVLEANPSSAWTPALEELFGAGPQLCFVRPDGYIGFRGTSAGEPLLSYARGLGLAGN